MEVDNEVRSKKVTFGNECIEVLSHENFTAGRLKQFLKEWKDITSDEFILDSVEGCHFEMTDESNLNQLNPSYRLKFNNKEIEIISIEIEKLLNKKVIEKCDHCSGEIISNIFIRQKNRKTKLIESY